jgi:fimbrial chaperone protein
MISWNSCRGKAAANALAAVLVVFLTGPAAKGQSLTVLPVNVWLQAGQRATTLTVTNGGTSETAIQIRAYGWNQQDGDDQLTTSDAVVVSPPIASIAPGATQVVRLILRQPPQGREATYRILVDQIPPPAEPGIVRVVLRLSIPIFALPTARAIPHLQFHIERDAGSAYLVAINDGGRHEAIRNVVPWTSDGRQLSTKSDASPYILAGATRRWPIAAQGAPPLPNETLRMTAHEDAGAVEQKVLVVATH